MNLAQFKQALSDELDLANLDHVDETTVLRDIPLTDLDITQMVFATQEIISNSDFDVKFSTAAGMTVGEWLEKAQKAASKQQN